MLGTSVGGKIFGVISEKIHDSQIERREQAERAHQADLAGRNQLTAYLDTINRPNPNGGSSPMQFVVPLILLVFAITYVQCVWGCFTVDPEAIIYTKDPTSETAVRELFFGFIRWDSVNDRVVAMSKAGLGALLLYPIIFILSSVTSLDRAPWKG